MAILKLFQIIVRPVHRAEESQFQELMQLYHYLGALPKIGNTIWYVATNNDEWVALISYSAAALKCGVRDHWIGWGFRHQYDRLHLVLIVAICSQEYVMLFYLYGIQVGPDSHKTIRP